MKIPIVYEKIEQQNFPKGYYYAYIPSLQLTTHGKGIPGAKKAAFDLIKLWIEEKEQNKESINFSEEYLFEEINV